jgi:hypothetical protein
MNCGSENRKHQDLRRHLNGKRDFTGSFESMWLMISRGRPPVIFYFLLNPNFRQLALRVLGFLLIDC